MVWGCWKLNISRCSGCYNRLLWSLFLPVHCCMGSGTVLIRCNMLPARWLMDYHWLHTVLTTCSYRLACHSSNSTRCDQCDSCNHFPYCHFLILQQAVASQVDQFLYPVCQHVDRHSEQDFATAGCRCWETLAPWSCPDCCYNPKPLCCGCTRCWHPRNQSCNLF